MEMSTTLTEEDAFRLQRQMAEREKEISRLVQHYKELDAKARSVKKQIKEEQRHRKAYGGVDAGKVQERLISKQVMWMEVTIRLFLRLHDVAADILRER